MIKDTLTGNDCRAVPKLTVLLMAFNAERFIDKAVFSLMSQETDFSFLVYAGNDGSSDGTIDKLRAYEVKYPGIFKAVITERIPRSHPGEYLNFANLFSFVNTEYFIVLDADDYYIDKYKLQKQVDFLDANKDFTVCGHNYYYEFDDGRRSPAYSSEEVEIFYPLIAERFDQLICGGFVPYMQTASVMYRNILKRDDPIRSALTQYQYNGDWIRTLIHGEHGKVRFLKDIMSVYTISDKGCWSAMSELSKEEHYVQFYNYHAKNTFSKDHTATVYRVMLNHINKLIDISVSRNDWLKVLFLYVKRLQCRTLIFLN